MRGGINVEPMPSAQTTAPTIDDAKRLASNLVRDLERISLKRDAKVADFDAVIDDARTLVSRINRARYGLAFESTRRPARKARAASTRA